MDAAQAIASVVERIRAGDLDYPVTGLLADQFLGGWCVYAPAMIADPADTDSDAGTGTDTDEPSTRSVFLVGDSGRVEEVRSSEPVHDARQRFEEACLWFGAAEHTPAQDFSLPSQPDLGGSARPPRTPADYDLPAIDVLARALTSERDFAGWLGDRLRELADLLGGGSRLISRRPNSWAADHVTELAAPDDPYDAGRTSVWQSWPPVDPASLPDVDTTGWLLIPGVALCDYLEAVEAETDAAGRLADAVAERARQAPAWLACGVSELLPQLVVLRQRDLPDGDLDTVRGLAAEHHADDVLDQLLLSPSPADADVEALVRIAVDADRHGRDTIDLDTAATAAYRRLLDRLELPFETYWFEAMVE
jgi:hypothetical protein